MEREFKALIEESHAHRTRNRPTNRLRPNESEMLSTPKPADGADGSPQHIDNDMESIAYDRNSVDTSECYDTPDLKWTLPKSPSKRKHVQNAKTTLACMNKFAILGNMPQEPSQSNSRDNAIHNPNSKPRTPPTADKKPRMPPIYCSQSSTKLIINEIRTNSTITDFHLTHNAGEPTLHTNNLEDYEAAKAILQKANVPFYTYTPQSAKKKMLVLKGLAHGYSTDEVLAELTALKLPDVKIEKIDKLVYNKNTPERYYYLIHLSPESKTQNLTSLKKLNYQLVKWEPYRKSKVFQCHKCQRVGHSSNNCNLGYRCVKCTQTHEPGKCLRSAETPDTVTAPMCVNCRNSHPANYRGCPYLKLAQHIDSSNKTARRNIKLTSPLTSGRRSYAAIAAAPKVHFTPKTQHPQFMTPQQPTTHHTVWTSQQASPTDNFNIKNLLDDFKNEIVNTLTLQNQNLMEVSTKINNRALENSAKIDYIFHKLNLKWE